ncbi:MAG: YbbR-like domain-containing protein [bacterium]|nr:YbbR-like domain-containing protein [bacterium]
MKTNLLDNFWLRVVALLMGILLWLHVATEKQYTYEVRLPVSEISLPEELSLISDPVDSVDVIVSATGKKLLRKKWRANGIRISATGFEAGRHTLTLNPSNAFLAGSDNAVTLDKIVFPTSIDLEIDFSMEKQVPVIPDIEATADEGFAVTGTMNPLPPEVTITGPRSLVKDISSIRTDHKVLTGLRNDITLIIPLVPLEGRDLVVAPDSVEVTVEVVPVKTVSFESIPIVVFNAPTDRQVYTDPAWISVELTGSPTEIDKLDRFAIVVSADYRHLAADGRAPLKIECPSKFSIKNASHDRVRIGFR